MVFVRKDGSAHEEYTCAWNADILEPEETVVADLLERNMSRDIINHNKFDLKNRDVLMNDEMR